MKTTFHVLTLAASLTLTLACKEDKKDEGQWVTEAEELQYFRLNSEIAGQTLQIKEDATAEILNSKDLAGLKIHDLCNIKVLKGTYSLVEISPNTSKLQSDGVYSADNLMTKVELTGLKLPLATSTTFIYQSIVKDIAIAGKRLLISGAVDLATDSEKGNTVSAKCELQKFQ